MWSLDNVVAARQDEVERGGGSPALYNQAFRRARAANGLLELIEGRYGPAVREATYALGADEDAVLRLLRNPA